MSENFYQKNKNEIIIIFIVFVFLNFVIYTEIFNLILEKNTEIYFLNVGQGDSQLIILPNNIKILIDGGPLNKNLILNLDKILPFYDRFYDRYIDLVINTHPQLDHYGGFIDLLKRYQIGYFINNGQESNNEYFLTLKKTIFDKNIKTIILDFKDKIIYQDSFF